MLTPTFMQEKPKETPVSNEKTYITFQIVIITVVVISPKN